MSRQTRQSQANVPGTMETATGYNILALISLLLGLGLPLEILAIVLDTTFGVGAKGAMPSTLTSNVGNFTALARTVGAPALLGAIITGHITLIRARRYPRERAWRWMAIVGLVAGYIFVVAVIGIIGLFLLASLNGF